MEGSCPGKTEAKGSGSGLYKKRDPSLQPFPYPPAAEREPEGRRVEIKDRLRWREEGGRAHPTSIIFLVI
jgi:hypothetical protein